MAERRQYDRLDTRLALSYSMPGSSVVGRSMVKNLSAGGVRFLAGHRLEAGQELELTIHFPDADPIVAHGKIIWREWRPSPDPAIKGVASDIGVQFTKLDPKDRQRLLEYVKLGLLGL
ncbi:MAG: PilZ domain-containing protein [Candidatus Omnitrophica bacterium]|nr:PilZ domain-containing protein [Candidatus Omnitrophota bacterium]